MHHKVSYGNLKTAELCFRIELCPPAQLGMPCMLLTQHWLALLRMCCQAQT